MSCTPGKHTIKHEVASGVLLAFVAAEALANPAGGDVVAGSATIDYGTTTLINQASDKAIINWQDFSVGEGQTTQFVQPSASSVTLNRVVGGNPSAILGNLKANGQVFLVNPNGIVFGPHAQIDVAGLVASTANVTNDDFMAGNYHFLNAPDGSYIENYGTISIANAGMAVLVAPSVKNFGVIQATMGDIVLASGKSYTLDLYGDELISFDANVLVNQGLVENLGALKANGGQILLTAQAADTVLESLINVDGYIEANAVGEYKGNIVLKADTINVSSNSNMNAHAGEIILFANNVLNSAGNMDARGGGFIETSAYNTVNITGGNIFAGLWLLDPVTLTIDNSLAATYNTSLNAGTDIIASTSDDLEFTNNTTALAWTTNATFTAIAGNNIIINAGGGTVINKTSGTGTINLRADSASPGSGTITFTSGSIASTSGANVNFYYNPSSFPTATDFSSNVTVSGGGVFNAYMLVNTAAQLQSMNSNKAGSYALNTNIDVNASIADFTSIGGEGAAAFTGKFTGSILGTQYTLTDLTISAAGLTNVGLFGSASGATITDVSLITPTISGASQVGGVMGLGTDVILTGTLAIQGGTITGTGTDAGGLIGEVTSSSGGSTITAAMTGSANVNGVTNVGGLIGRALGLTGNPVTISGSSDFTATGGSITGTTSVGGLVGRLDAFTTFTRTGTVSTSSSVSINPSLAATGANFGGLFGYVTGAITSSSDFSPTSLVNNALVNPNTSSGTLSNIGGIIGLMDKTGLIIPTAFTNHGQVFAGNLGTSTVFGAASVAGLIGRITGTASSVSEFTGAMTSDASVYGGQDVGGLIGFAEGVTISGSADFKLLSNGNNVVIQGIGTVGNTGVAGLIAKMGASDNLITTFSRTGSIMTDISGGGSILVHRTNPAPNAGGLFGLISRNGVRFMPCAGTPSCALVNYANVLMSDTGTGGNPSSYAGVIAQLVALEPGFETISVNMTNYGNVTNSSSAIPAVSATGGVIGFAANLNVSNVGPIFTGTLTNYGDIIANADAGGVIGALDGVAASSGRLDGTAINYGNVTTTVNTGSDIQGTGGVIGIIDGPVSNLGVSLGSNAVLSNLGGTVTGVNQVGGVIGAAGVNAISLTSQPFTNTGNVIASGNDVGGGVGYWNSSSAIAAIFNSGNVTGTTNVGGAVGNLNAGSLSAAFNEGTISGTSQVGGGVGLIASGITVSNILVGGTVTGSGTDIGGIVGQNNGTVNTALSVATISGSGSNKGILIGNNVGTLLNGLYDSGINASSVSVIGTGNNSGYSSGTGISFDQFAIYNAANFVFSGSGWSFTAGAGYYASPSFCASSSPACLIAISLPIPPPTPSLTVAAQTYRTIQQQLRNAELDNNPAYDQVELWNLSNSTRNTTIHLSTLQLSTLQGSLPVNSSIVRQIDALPAAVQKESKVIFVHPGHPLPEAAHSPEYSAESLNQLINLLAKQSLDSTIR